MPKSLLLWSALSSSWPIRHSSIKYCKDLLSQVWRHLLSTVQVSRQYPSLLWTFLFPFFFFLKKGLISDLHPKLRYLCILHVLDVSDFSCACPSLCAFIVNAYPWTADLASTFSKAVEWYLIWMWLSFSLSLTATVAPQNCSYEDPPTIVWASHVGMDMGWDLLIQVPNHSCSHHST